MGKITACLTARLTETFRPLRLEIHDDSDKHKGHSGAREGGESHFSVTIVSESFIGLSRVERHRRVNAALKAELDGPVHALSLRTLTPEEAEKV